MIEKFKTLRTIPQLNIDLIVVFLKNGRSFYCLVPCDRELSNENVLEYKISNCLYEYFLFVDFPNNY